jgi:O-antigen/teichoic acid export membrane protein
MSAVLKDSTLYLAANLANRGVSFLMIPLYTRYLSSAQYGIVELTDLTISLLSLTLGAQALSGAFIKMYFEQPAGEKRERVVSTSLFLTVIASVAIAALGVLAAGPAGRLILGSGDLSAFFAVTCMAIVPAVVTEFALTYERARNGASVFVMLSVVQVVLTAAFNAVLLIEWHAGIWTFVTSKLVITTLQLGVLLWRMRRDIHLTFDRTHARAQATMGLPLIGSGLAMFAILFSDRFFLQGYLGPSDVGLFSLAFKFGFLVSILVGDPFQRAWSLRIFDESRQPGFQASAGQTLTWLACALTLAAAGLSLACMSAIKILVGPDFVSVAVLVPFVCVSSMLRSLGDFYRAFLQLDRTLTFTALVPMTVAVVSVSSNFVLIPRFGLWGAAVSGIVIWAMYLCVAVIFARYRKISVPSPLRVVGFPLMGVATVATRLLVPRLGVLADLCIDALFMVSLMGLLWVSPLLRAEHKEGLKQQMRAIRRRLMPQLAQH